MKIGQKFNTLTLKEYFYIIDHYKKYTDFNSLGLYRSIVENEKLTLEEKIAVREYAHRVFKKFFDFLQLKDPVVFIEVSTLGQELTYADEEQLWKNVRQNQQKILAGKKIKHRNFGTYSKHDCGYDTCFMNGLMIRQGSWLGVYGNCSMRFKSDNRNYMKDVKSDQRKADRKNKAQIIKKALDNDPDQPDLL